MKKTNAFERRPHGCSAGSIEAAEILTDELVGEYGDLSIFFDINKEGQLSLVAEFSHRVSGMALGGDYTHKSRRIFQNVQRGDVLDKFVVYCWGVYNPTCNEIFTAAAVKNGVPVTVLRA